MTVTFSSNASFPAFARTTFDLCSVLRGCNDEVLSFFFIEFIKATTQHDTMGKISIMFNVTITIL